jgi:hypothetical protein
VAVIQLDFSEVYDRWWIEASRWAEWGLIDTIARPTEDAALENIYRQARLLQRAGTMLDLSRLHREALRHEYYCKRNRPYDLDAANYVGERLHMGKQMAAAVLAEASLILQARDVLGLPTVYDWRVETVEQGGRRKKAA